MTAYRYSVIVTTDTDEHALQVIQERTGFDEELEDPQGVKFDYTIDVDYSAPANRMHDALRRIVELTSTKYRPENPRAIFTAIGDLARKAVES